VFGVPFSRHTYTNRFPTEIVQIIHHTGYKYWC